MVAQKKIATRCVIRRITGEPVRCAFLERKFVDEALSVRLWANQYAVRFSEENSEAKGYP